MAYPVLDIADEVLRSAKAKGIPLTPLKLMKLVYMAYGWFWANRDEPLFNERIEAWKYGPVIPHLYHASKKFGRDVIPEDLILDGVTTNDDIRGFIDKVVDEYGEMSGFSLSSLTHQPDTPWEKVCCEGVSDIEIPPTLIRDHYQKDLRDRRNLAAA